MYKEGIESILEYWFEGVDDETIVKKKALPFKKWFVQSRRVDQEICARFEKVLVEAAEGKYKDWEESVRGRLALILLFDQFSRNIYRGTLQMYAYDALALDLILRSIQEKFDQQTNLIERIFFYMPLMHAEDLKAQKLSIECFERLVKESKIKSSQNAAYYQYHFSHAQKYYDLILKEGRFLHRDKY